MCWEQQPISRGNRFRHQVYRSDRPTSPYQLLQPECLADPSSAEFGQQIATAGKVLGRANVVAIYCVHGTFVGNDALGLLTELARFTPSLSEALGQFGKQTVDRVVGESGNFTPEYAAAMEAALGDGAGRSIPVRRFNWSSQNNHIGRADGAVQLLVELAELAHRLPDSQLATDLPSRVLLWGHSHAGNVFALLSNLLASDAEKRQSFFRAARCFYRRLFSRRVDMPAWARAEQLLGEAEHPLRRLALDVVTFGTPIRYGWDTGGFANLLHFVNHRPVAGRPDYLAPKTIDPRRLLTAADGDYVQQIGIAGSNLIPNFFAIRTLISDRRLSKLLEHNLRRERLTTRMGYGMRVPEVGETLLVDYPDSETAIHRQLLGHAVYTRQKWLPFHLEQVAAHFYAKT